MIGWVVLAVVSVMVAAELANARALVLVACLIGGIVCAIAALDRGGREP